MHNFLHTRARDTYLQYKDKKYKKYSVENILKSNIFTYLGVFISVVHSRYKIGRLKRQGTLDSI